VQESPALLNATFFEVPNLEPGDVLLIPPFWLHFIHVAPTAPATSYSIFSTCEECEFLKAKVPRPTAGPPEALSRILGLLHGAFGGAPLARTLEVWGLSGVAKVVRRPGGPMPSDDDASRSRTMLAEFVLRRSLRATPHVSEIFCSVPVPRCPKPPELQNGGPLPYAQALGSQWQWAEAVRATVKDEHIAMTILQSEIEDLAFGGWGPKHVCSAIERCILPLLG